MLRFFGLVIVVIALPLVTHAVKRSPAPPAHLSYYQVLNFKKGVSKISAVDQESIEALVTSIKEKKQKIDQAHIAVWSDRAFSMAAALPQKDRDLAEERIATIEDELESRFGIGNVESYNMAQRSNWFARAYGSSDKELKTLFATQGAPANVAPEDFQTVKAKGGPTKAVILIELEAAP